MKSGGRMAAQSQPALRVGVVGCGFFGDLHARKYAAAPEAHLTAVCDVVPERAEATARRHGARGLVEPAALIGEVDAVSIATPASTHYEIAALFLKAGIHVLLEKPIALSLAHADELIALAEQNGLVLQVGHQERFVFEQFGLLSRRKAPQRIDVSRAGPFSGRATDVSAVFDLMIHDLDLVHRLVKGTVVSVEAEAKAVHGAHPDEASAVLVFDTGCVVSLHASRISSERRRFMRVTYDDGLIDIDFVNRTLTNSTPAPLHPVFEDDGAHRAVASDPLGFGVRAFLTSITTRQPPRITGYEARQALETALRITRVLAGRSTTMERVASC